MTRNEWIENWKLVERSGGHTITERHYASGRSQFACRCGWRSEVGLRAGGVDARACLEESVREHRAGITHINEEAEQQRNLAATKDECPVLLRIGISEPWPPLEEDIAIDGYPGGPLVVSGPPSGEMKAYQLLQGGWVNLDNLRPASVLPVGIPDGVRDLIMSLPVDIFLEGEKGRADVLAMIESRWSGEWYRKEQARMDAMGASIGLPPSRYDYAADHERFVTVLRDIARGT